MSSPPRTHAKLADVAAAAGVSLSTASRALRDHPAVKQGTRRRVRAAASKLGYEPNRIASALRTQSWPFVGIIVPDIAIPFYARAVKGAQRVLGRAGYQVLVMNTDRDPEAERAALRALLAHRAQGVLLATSGGFSGSGGIPLVFFANYADGFGVGRVALSNRDGIVALFEHLASIHGHRRIGFVGGPDTSTSGCERVEGFESAARSGGLDCGPYVRLCDDAWSPESAERAALELLRLPERPTAVIAGGDTIALGTIRATRKLGLRVPDDVALASFQTPDIGDLLEPPLTTIASRERELGEHAAVLLLHSLEAEGEPSSVTEVRLPALLALGRSCGCS